MHSKHPKLTIAAATVLVVAGFFQLQHVREKHNAAKREADYQLILAQYSSELKAGMKREHVEQYFRREEILVKHICCVANYRGEPVTLSNTYDDLVKIGEESAPWFCSEHNVYIAFEFNPKTQREAPDTRDSDILKRVSVFHQLEKCI